MPVLVGSAPTIADLSCCGYLFWLDRAGIDPNDYPNIKRWLSEIAGLPYWRSPEDLFTASTQTAARR